MSEIFVLIRFLRRQDRLQAFQMLQVRCFCRRKIKKNIQKLVSMLLLSGFFCLALPVTPTKILQRLLLFPSEIISTKVISASSTFVLILTRILSFQDVPFRTCFILYLFKVAIILAVVIFYIRRFHPWLTIQLGSRGDCKSSVFT